MKTLIAVLLISTSVLSFSSKAEGLDYTKKKHYACADVARQMVAIAGDKGVSESAYRLCSRSYDQASAGFSETKAVSGVKSGGQWAEAIVRFAYIAYSSDFENK